MKQNQPLGAEEEEEEKGLKKIFSGFLELFSSSGAKKETEKKKKDWGDRLGGAVSFLLKAALFLAPLAFLPFGSVIGLGKQVIFGTLVFLAFVFWVAKALLTGSFDYKENTPLKVVVFLVLVSGLSLLLNPAKYEAFFGASGNFLNFYNIIVLAFLFWLLITEHYGRGTQNIAEEDRGTLQKNSAEFSGSGSAKFSALRWFLWGGVVAIIFGILQLVGVYVLPLELAQDSFFNTLGSINSLAIFSGLMTALGLGLILKAERDSKAAIGKGEAGVLMITGLLYVLLAGYVPVWYGLIITSFIYFVRGVLGEQLFEGEVNPDNESTEKAALEGKPLIIFPVFVIFILALVAVSSNFVADQNILNLGRYFNAASPVEVGVSQGASFGLVSGVYSEGWKSRFLGSGWSSYAKEWAQHKDKSIAQTQFWEVGFQKGASGFTTVLVEGGLLIAFALLLLFANTFWKATQRRNWVVLGGISYLAVLWFFYPFVLTLWVAVFVLAAGRD